MEQQICMKRTKYKNSDRDRHTGQAARAELGSESESGRVHCSVLSLQRMNTTIAEDLAVSVGGADTSYPGGLPWREGCTGRAISISKRGLKGTVSREFLYVFLVLITKSVLY
jgi:hypothetical protein